MILFCGGPADGKWFEVDGPTILVPDDRMQPATYSEEFPPEIPPVKFCRYDRKRFVSQLINCEVMVAEGTTPKEAMGTILKGSMSKCIHDPYWKGIYGTCMACRAEKAERERDRWKAIAEKRHAILLNLEWSSYDHDDEDYGSYCPCCTSMDDEAHVAGCKMAEAIAESARAANEGREVKRGN